MGTSKNNNELRHKIFGTIKKGKNEKIEVPQGTKILPWIYEENNRSNEKNNESNEENNKLGCGFVSIAGIINLNK